MPKVGLFGQSTVAIEDSKLKAVNNRDRSYIDHYRNLSACHGCVMRLRRTTENVKRVKRWKREAVIDAMQRQLDLLPNAVGTRIILTHTNDEVRELNEAARGRLRDAGILPLGRGCTADAKRQPWGMECTGAGR